MKLINGSFGYGGILSNLLGQWISGCSGSCGLDCVPISRLWTPCHLLWSLSCLQSRLRDVVCEYDSTVALKLILEETSKFHPHATLINSINQVSGESNVCANWLANLSLEPQASDNSFLVWQHCPPKLSLSLLADAGWDSYQIVYACLVCFAFLSFLMIAPTVE